MEVEVEVMETGKRLPAAEHPSMLVGMANLSVDVLESRAMEGGRRAVCASDIVDRKFPSSLVAPLRVWSTRRFCRPSCILGLSS